MDQVGEVREQIFTPERYEFDWRAKLYVHFVTSEEDADQIVEEGRLRTSKKYQGREDRIFAVDLDETLRDDLVQLGRRVWGILFTTPEADSVMPFRKEVYWFANKRDKRGGYIPLDLAIKLDLQDVRTARELLGTISPEWGEPDESGDD